MNSHSNKKIITAKEEEDNILFNKLLVEARKGKKLSHVILDSGVGDTRARDLIYKRKEEYDAAEREASAKFSFDEKTEALFQQYLVKLSEGKTKKQAAKELDLLYGTVMNWKISRSEEIEDAFKKGKAQKSNQEKAIAGEKRRHTPLTIDELQQSFGIQQSQKKQRYSLFPPIKIEEIIEETSNVDVSQEEPKIVDISISSSPPKSPTRG